MTISLKKIQKHNLAILFIPEKNIYPGHVLEIHTNLELAAREKRKRKAKENSFKCQTVQSSGSFYGNGCQRATKHPSDQITNIWKHAYQHTHDSNQTLHHENHSHPPESQRP